MPPVEFNELGRRCRPDAIGNFRKRRPFAFNQLSGGCWQPATTNKFQGASFACNRGGDALLNAAGSRRNKALHYAFNVCGQRTESNAPTKTSAERPLAFKPWLEAISNSNVFNKSEPRHSCFRRYGKARWFANV